MCRSTFSISEELTCCSLNIQIDPPQFGSAVFGAQISLRLPEDEWERAREREREIEGEGESGEWERGGPNDRSISHGAFCGVPRCDLTSESASDMINHLRGLYYNTVKGSFTS